MSELRTKCHGCGRAIVRDDAKLKISHEAPVCDWFQTIVATAGRHETTIELEVGGKLVPRTPDRHSS